MKLINKQIFAAQCVMYISHTLSVFMNFFSYRRLKISPFEDFLVKTVEPSEICKPKERRDIMSNFNFGYATKKFLEDKQKEEEVLRKAGISEEKIQLLREFDWEQLKKERCFHRHEQVTSDGFFNPHPKYYYDEYPIRSFDDLTDIIEDAKLFIFLIGIDDPTLQKIIFLYSIGFTANDISKILGLSTNAVYKRFNKIKKKKK